MKMKDLKYYAKDEVNCHCLFQPAADNAHAPDERLNETNQLDADHNPLYWHRIPIPRLAPPGIK